MSKFKGIPAKDSEWVSPAGDVVCVPPFEDRATVSKRVAAVLAMQMELRGGAAELQRLLDESKARERERARAERERIGRMLLDFAKNPVGPERDRWSPSDWQNCAAELGKRLLRKGHLR